MSNIKERKEEPLHRILREVYRHYIIYRDFVGSTGKHVIDHGYWVTDEEGNRLKFVEVTISFWDLHKGLNNLAPRKKEAVFYNVILDMKQKDVAKIMGITTVSVGQYVDQAFIQLAKDYFAGEEVNVVLS